MGDFVKLPSQKKLKEAFDDLCIKGSKKLTLEQFKKLCYTFYLSPTNNGIAQLFKELDKNNDDLLSFDEVETLIKKQWTPINERKEAFLKDLRKARTGKGPITRAELKTILQNGSDEALTDEDLNYCFDKMDINKDNQISEEELIELVFKIEEALSRAPSSIMASMDEKGHRSRSRSSSLSDDSSSSDKKHKSRSRSTSPRHSKKDRKHKAVAGDNNKSSDLVNSKRKGSGKQTKDGKIIQMSNGQNGKIGEPVNVEQNVDVKYLNEDVNQEIEDDKIKFGEEESQDEIEMENGKNDEEQEDVPKNINENKNKNTHKFNGTIKNVDEQEAKEEDDDDDDETEEDNENEDEQEDNENADAKEYSKIEDEEDDN